MEQSSGKFLVNLVNQFTDTQMFFGGWFIVTAFFVFMMISFRRQGTRRNFRDSPYKVKDLRPPGKSVVPQNDSEERSVQKR